MLKFKTIKTLLLALAIFLVSLSAVYAAEGDAVPPSEGSSQKEETIVITVDGSKAQAESGEGDASLLSVDIVPPTAPDNLYVSRVTDTTITIEWLPSLDNQGVAEYLVYNNYELIGNTDVTEYVLTDVADGDVFNLSVRATDFTGNISDSSNILCIYHVAGTGETRVITAPYSLSVNKEWDNKLTLTWKSDESGSDISYEIYNGSVLVGTTKETYYVVNGLTSQQGYTFKVRAKNLDSIYSEFSNQINYTYNGNYVSAPLLPPENLAIGTAMQNSVTLNWDAPEDTTDLLEYVVYDEDRVVGKTSANSYTVVGLVNEDTYVFTVRAKAYDGSLSDPSNTVLLYHVSEDNNEQITVKAAVNQNNVTVSGKALANNEVALTVRNIQNISVYTASAVCNVADRSYVFYFAMPENSESGVYTVTVTGEGITSPAVTTFNYNTAVVSELTAEMGTGNSLNVSGKTNLGEGKCVTLKITKQGETTPLFDEIEVETSANGFFTFEPITLIESGTYIVMVNCEGLYAPVTKTVTCEVVGDVTYDINVNNDVVTVSGHTGAGANKQVTILVRDLSQNIAYVDQDASNSEGNFEFVFAMPDNSADGQYKVLVGGENVQTPVYKTFLYKALITCEVSVNENNISVSGYTAAGSGKQVTVAVKDRNKNIVYENTQNSSLEGNFQISFAMPESAGSGDYEVGVSGEGIAESAIKTFTYVKTILESYLDGEISISGYVLTFSGTVNCAENKRMTLFIKDTNKNIVYLDKNINYSSGSTSFTCTLPSLLTSAQYIIEIKSYSISNTGIETESATFSANLNLSSLTASLSGSAKCGANNRVIITAIDDVGNLFNKTKEIKGSDGTYTVSESISSLLLITGSADITMACYGTVTPEIVNAPVTVTADVNVNREVIKVSGNISSGEDKNVTVLVRDEDQNIAYVDQELSGTDGYYEFSFLLPNNKEGTYTVRVGGEGIDSPVTKTFVYEIQSDIISFNTNVNGKVINIVGSTNYDGGKALSLNIYKKSEIDPVFTVAKTTLTRSDGSFSFEQVVLPDTLSNGKYVAKVTSGTASGTNEFWIVQGNVVVAEVISDGGLITVSGLTGAGEGKAVTILAKDNASIVYVDQENSGANGSFEFKFLMPDNAAQGYYTVLIGGEDIPLPLSLGFTYGQAPAAPLTATVNIGENSITVSGTTSAGSGKTITLGVTKQGENAPVFTTKTTQTGSGGSFSFTIAASELPGNGVYTATVSVEGITETVVKSFAYPKTTEALTAPVLLPLNDTDITDKSVKLTWYGAQGGTGNVTYAVYVNDSLYAENISSTSFNIIHLSPLTTYRLKVVAKDLLDNFSESNGLSVTTKEEPFANPSTQINCAIGTQYNIIINASQVNTHYNLKFEIIYDDDVLQITDLVGKTFDEEKLRGIYEGITVESVSKGSIVFEITGIYPESGKAWSGTLNIFRFKAIASDKTQITLRKV